MLVYGCFGISISYQNVFPSCTVAPKCSFDSCSVSIVSTMVELNSLRKPT